MRSFSPSLGAFLVLVVASFAQAQELAGRYELRGETDAHAGCSATVRIEASAGGRLRVTRTGRVAAGPSATWTAEGTPSGLGLSLRYEIPAASPGIVGALGGAPAGKNLFAATYTLSADGLRLTEALKNETRLAPDDRWTTIATAGGRWVEGQSYGDLAGLSLPPLFESLLGSLAKLGPDTLPHETKALRKEIVAVRDLLDLFAFAYPDARPDEWKRLRSSLDEGYEKVGAFKDLFDVQGLASSTGAVYDRKEVRERRAAVLDWYADFSKPSALASARSFLASPERKSIVKRKASDLSPFFWGEAGLLPEHDLNGVENLARLVKKLVVLARKDLDDTVALDDLTKAKKAVAFHDFRKRVRTILKVTAAFPQVFEATARPEGTLGFLDEVVTRFGAIEDRIVARQLALDRGQEKKAKDIAKEIARLWKELRDWQDDHGLDGALKELGKAVR